MSHQGSLHTATYIQLGEPMNTNHRTACTISAVSVILAYTSATPAAPAATESSVVPLEASTLIIEFNASDRDIGVQFFIDSEGWRSVQVFDPKASPRKSFRAANRRFPKRASLNCSGAISIRFRSRPRLCAKRRENNPPTQSNKSRQPSWPVLTAQDIS